MKQTILGAGGAIGIELAKSLANYTQQIRLVARHPQKVNPNDELFPADLTKKEDVFNAVAGSNMVYVSIGFPYALKTWQALWPPFIKNVIEACIHHQAKLVFFDNVYAIGAAHVHHITESSPMSPSSRKGEVRAELDRHLLQAIEKHRLDVIIARAPDFFSEVKQNSLLMNLVYDNLVKGKKAQWMCDPKKIHSMGYAPELAKGTAMLGNTLDAYNQIWNLPVDPQKITGEGWIQLFADAMQASPQYRVLPNWLIKALGLFIPVMREIPEMNYQFTGDYFFDSSKFCKHFGYTPMQNKDAVTRTIERLNTGKASK